MNNFSSMNSLETTILRQVQAQVERDGKSYGSPHYESYRLCLAALGQERMQFFNKLTGLLAAVDYVADETVNETSEDKEINLEELKEWHRDFRRYVTETLEDAPYCAG